MYNKFAHFKRGSGDRVSTSKTPLLAKGSNNMLEVVRHHEKELKKDFGMELFSMFVQHAIPESVREMASKNGLFLRFPDEIGDNESAVDVTRPWSGGLVTSPHNPVFKTPSKLVHDGGSSSYTSRRLDFGASLSRAGVVSTPIGRDILENNSSSSIIGNGQSNNSLGNSSLNAASAQNVNSTSSVANPADSLTSIGLLVSEEETDDRILAAKKAVIDVKAKVDACEAAMMDYIKGAEYASADKTTKELKLGAWKRKVAADTTIYNEAVSYLTKCKEVVLKEVEKDQAAKLAVYREFKKKVAAKKNREQQRFSGARFF